MVPRRHLHLHQQDRPPGRLHNLTVTATSSSSGIALIENNTTGQNVSQALTSNSALCPTNAEWIVEHFESAETVLFADFGAVAFGNASEEMVGVRVWGRMRRGRWL